MKRRICVRFIGVPVVLIALAIMTISSCGEEITKATTISQVIDAHFKYEDIQIGFERQLGYNREPAVNRFGQPIFDAYLTGKITNNSGINLRAYFDVDCDNGLSSVLSQEFTIG